MNFFLYLIRENLKLHLDEPKPSFTHSNLSFLTGNMIFTLGGYSTIELVY